MTRIPRKLFVTMLACLIVSGNLYSQQYRVHRTERTIPFRADNVSIHNISNCVGGVFVARESSKGISYIIDTLGNTLGAFYLQDGVGSFFPNFYGGKVATAVFNDGTPAVINTNGEIIKQFPGGRAISMRFVDGLALVKIIEPKTYKTIVAYINERGEFVFKHLTMQDESNISLEVSPLKEGRRRFYDSGKGLYGFIDENGKIVIPAKFKAAHDFSEGLAAFTCNDGSVEYWGFIDDSGNEVIHPMFRSEPGDYHNGYALVKKQNGKYVYIDKEANERSQEYYKATRFFGGYALINAQNKYGGEYGVDPTKCYVVDKHFRRIRTINFFSPNYIQYNEYNNTFIMDDVVFNPDGIMKLNPTRPGSLIRDFIEDIALYHCDDYTGFINSKGELLMVILQGSY